MRMVVYGVVIALVAFGISLAALNLSGSDNAAAAMLANSMEMEHSAMTMGDNTAGTATEMDHEHPLLNIAEGTPCRA